MNIFSLCKLKNLWNSGTMTIVALSNVNLQDQTVSLRVFWDPSIQ